MPSTVDQLSSTRVKLTIEIPFEELKPALNKAYREIAEQVNIPGFRKGKVPPAVIDQRFGRGVVLQEAINDALPEAYNNAITEHDIKPLGQPDVEVTELEDGKRVEFTAEVDVRPEFDLPDFSAITAEVPAVKADEDELNERLDMLRERFAVNTEVDRAAAQGDVLTIDLVGKQDGKVLEDATAEGITYKVGNAQMLDGLEEAVIGLKAGEEATFTSTLLGGAHKDEEAEITVKVHKVEEQELPEVDDEFAQLISEFDTVEEMKADLQQAIEYQAKAEQLADARDLVLEQAVKVTEFELPEKLVESELAARKEQVQAQLMQAGLTVEEYLEGTEEETDDNEEDFWKTIEQRGTDALRAQIILDKYADDEEIGVEQHELTELIFRKAQQNGTTPEQEANHMMEHGHLPEWMQEIRRGKALAKIVELAKIVDTEGNEIKPDPAPGDDEPQIETFVDAAEAEKAFGGEAAVEIAVAEAENEEN